MEHSTTKQILFYAVYSKHLTNNFPKTVKVVTPIAKDFVKLLMEIQSAIQENIVVVQS